MTQSNHEELPDETSAVTNFFRYVIPSIVSLLAISTASVVDGFFVGNFLGADALASVNLLMPYFALLFGIALMLAVGGSVKAGIYIGKKDFSSASSLFSQILLVVVALNIVIVPISLIFSDYLFKSLGAAPELYGLMQDYFGILCFAMVVQLACLVIYYFIRADNHPVLGMRALMLGAFVNIVLDALFIYGLDWGIQGAALATLIAQSVQLAYILSYFKLKNANLKLMWPKLDRSELGFSAFNGFSEFVNEISIGIVILVFHYLIYISLMVYYGIVDAMHVLLSRNFGAGRLDRVVVYMRLATASIAVLSVSLVVILHLFQSQIVGLFLDSEAGQARELAESFVDIVWPIFLFNGFNVLICAYLTSAEQAMHSTIIALLRSLLLPIVFVLALSFVLPGIGFIYAVPVAEAMTFLCALAFFIWFRPSVLNGRIAA